MGIFADFQIYLASEFENNLIFLISVYFSIISVFFALKFGFIVGKNYFISKKIWQKD